jgi:hypothetical protein
MVKFQAVDYRENRMMISLNSAVLVAIISSLFWQDLPVQKTGDADVPVGYSSIRETLPNATRVPLHLPTFIPFLGDPQHPVFSILETKDLRSYAIQLAWARDCDPMEPRWELLCRWNQSGRREDGSKDDQFRHTVPTTRTRTLTIWDRGSNTGLLRWAAA